MTEAMGFQVVGNVGSALLSTSDPRVQAGAMTAYGLTTKLGLELPHSRAQESEADHIGLIYMTRAGYEPEAAVQFWERFSAFNQKQGGNTPAFLRTHPTDATRIEQLQKWIPEAKAKKAPAR